MPEQNKRKISTIIWTYSSKEEAAFKKMLSSLGQTYQFNAGGLQLWVLAQTHIFFEKDNGQIFLRIKAGVTEQNNGEQFIEEIQLDNQTILLSHDLGSVEGFEHIPAGALLDYSSADYALHQKMMSGLERVNNVGALIHLAQDWVDVYFKDYKEELIRRAKQYALNLFLTLSIEVRSIQNIWEKKELDRLQKLLAALSEQWEGELSVSHSPDSQLLRFWYLLAGEHFNWQEKDLCPPGDVYLPVDQYQKVAQPLWEWIKFFYGDAFEETSEAWTKLLELSGLEQQGQKFAEVSSATIAKFIDILKVIIKSENPHWWLQALATKSKSDHPRPLDYLWYLLATTDLEPRIIDKLSLGKPDYAGIEAHLSELKQTQQDAAINNFYEWLHSLNRAFDELKEEIKNLESYEPIGSFD